MSVYEALIAFTAAAALLTLTPGLDTALVLRTAAVEGPKRAALAGLGIGMGCLVWGAAVAFGLGAVLSTSQLAFVVLRWAGAAYLVWLGIRLLIKPRDSFDPGDAPVVTSQGDFAWMRRGLLTNLLNPKIGVFYVSFLPQFLPEGVMAAPFIFLLACLHVGLGLMWFGVLIAATQPLAETLRHPAVVRWADRITGGVFICFGLRLALQR